MNLREEALHYHKKGRKGKVEVTLTKECKTQHDITLAYSPGVAEPCIEIDKNPEAVFDYTAKGNLVAVVSNGTAVLGLGKIGPLASKPVMEGKAVLFKTFADIDCFDIELNANTAEEVIQACKYMEPTFGGINLEDIGAPDCFEIEERLQEELDIPVFHDDQHGTAIVSGAALLNALDIVNKKIEDIIVVVNGAGAAGTACAKMYLTLGVKKENLLLCDRKGVIRKGESGYSKFKERFAVETDKVTLADALNGADVFCGCSVGGVVSQEMVKSMARDPIVFAMANPEPEIMPDLVKEVRPDAITATGRSDFPNQVNNVLGFPYIFRGALDVHARSINDEMKMAAVKAIAKLAKEDVPEVIGKTYGRYDIAFGKDYLIPKPFDQRLLLWVAPAVAKAAMDTGVARREIDLDRYVDELDGRLGADKAFIRRIQRGIHKSNKEIGRVLKVAFPEGSSTRVLRAAEYLKNHGICEPLLIGTRAHIEKKIKEFSLNGLTNASIIEPRDSEYFDGYVEQYYKDRCRKGVTERSGRHTLRDNYHAFASMMVKQGDADTQVSGVGCTYPDALKPALQVIGAKKDETLAGVFILIWREKMIFISDTTIHIEPSADELADIAIQTHDLAKLYLKKEEPRVAMLSFSNFGSNSHEQSTRVRLATEKVKDKRPDIEIDGEMQADTAVNEEILKERFPFSTLSGPANVLIVPSVTSGNIAYKLLAQLGGATIIGPILTGMNKGMSVVQQNATVDEIVNLSTLMVYKYHQQCCKK